MKNLPFSETYEKEFEYMPWKTILEKVLGIVVNKSPEKGKVLDLMCGPGYLLDKIKERRSDLFLVGVDINEEFIAHAKKRNPDTDFFVEDVMEWTSGEKFDIVTCTGGLHHLPYEKHENFLKKIRELMNTNGICIVADPYVDDYTNEKERKTAASKLGYEYLLAVIEKNAPSEILAATIDILHNDVLKYEFKTSIIKIKPIFERFFSNVEIHKTWPNSDSQYGDYYILAKNK